MKSIPTKQKKAVLDLIKDARALRLKVKRMYKSTKYEDLEHAGLGLQIVEHALREVEEGKGMGGDIKSVRDASAHQEAERLLSAVENLQEEAKTLLKTHPNEDLETAIKALEISKGSLEEVAERYE
jgi:hypothetical protein